ncbi:hypothetical protein N7456_005836 [Penicillium angulare]|uniref:Uncharacterized protein n=1 Tax=Penicillium angulare TaxID=116970 RepID=A0A9W9FZA3_9EURO|nr:hypothetical protein N7456_005836 [Penicillium angulare]
MSGSHEHLCKVKVLLSLSVGYLNSRCEVNADQPIRLQNASPSWSFVFARLFAYESNLVQYPIKFPTQDKMNSVLSSPPSSQVNNIVHNHDTPVEFLQRELQKRDLKIMELERNLDVVNRQRVGVIKDLRVENAEKSTAIQNLQTEVARLEALDNQRQRTLRDNARHLSRAQNQVTRLREKLRGVEDLVKKYEDSRDKWKEIARKESRRGSKTSRCFFFRCWVL